MLCLISSTSYKMQLHKKQNTTLHNNIVKKKINDSIIQNK